MPDDLSDLADLLGADPTKRAKTGAPNKRVNLGGFFAREDRQPVGFRMSQLYSAGDGTIGRKLSTCSKVVGPIAKDTTIHVVSFANWWAEHVIAHVLDQCGPMHLAFCTWSMSPSAALKLMRAKAAGALLTVRALLDVNLCMRRPEAFEVIRRSLDEMDARTMQVHAKVYCLHNENWHVVILGSQNLTENPRLEALVVAESEELWRFHSGWLTRAIDGADVFGVLEETR